VFVAGLAGAIWSASGYVAAFMRASNSIYEVEEDRSFVKRLPTRVGVTVVLLVMLVVIGAAVTFTGPLARQVGDIIGLGSTAVSVWDIAKWPVVLLMATTMVALLYWAAPDVEHPRFAWMTPGSIVAVALWLLASAGFAIYVANFGSYNKTYGALGGVIAFLVWLWISNVAVLLGAQLNAETERRRQAGDGLASAPQSPAAPQAQTAAARRWPGPSGRPSAVKPAGTLMPGHPSTFHGHANGHAPTATRSVAYPFSPSSAPTASGGCAVVGARTTSALSKTHPMRRASGPSAARAARSAGPRSRRPTRRFSCVRWSSRDTSGTRRDQSYSPARPRGSSDSPTSP